MLSCSLTKYEVTQAKSIAFKNKAAVGVIGGIGVGFRVGRGNIVFDIRAFRAGNFDYYRIGAGENTFRRGAMLMPLLGYEFCF